MIGVNETYRKDGVLILSLHRPERLNALNMDMILKLQEALNEIEHDHEVNVLIMKSKVEKAFCTGVDVSYVQSLSNEEAADFFGKMAELLERLSTYPKLTIAAVNGYAFGGGADLAIACDLRIGTKSSTFRFPGPQFGLILGTDRLIHEIGPSRARFLTLTNERIDAATALDYGLIHDIVLEEKLFESVIERGKQFARMPSHVLKSLKRLTNDNGDNMTPEQWTRQSVLIGDFKERFTTYVERKK